MDTSAFYCYIHKPPNREVDNLQTTQQRGEQLQITKVTWFIEFENYLSEIRTRPLYDKKS
jgi:hypothetical protein